MYYKKSARKYIDTSDVASLILAGHRKGRGVCAEVLSNPGGVWF